MTPAELDEGKRLVAEYDADEDLDDISHHDDLVDWLLDNCSDLLAAEERAQRAEADLRILRHDVEAALAHSRGLMDAADKALNAASRHIDDIERERDEAREVLRRVQWSQVGNRCPSCGASHVADGGFNGKHAPDCALARALGGAK